MVIGHERGWICECMRQRRKLGGRQSWKGPPPRRVPGFTHRNLRRSVPPRQQQYRHGHLMMQVHHRHHRRLVFLSPLFRHPSSRVCSRSRQRRWTTAKLTPWRTSATSTPRSSPSPVMAMTSSTARASGLWCAAFVLIPLDVKFTILIFFLSISPPTFLSGPTFFFFFFFFWRGED